MPKFDINYLFTLNTEGKKALYSLIERINMTTVYKGSSPENIREGLLRQANNDSVLREIDAQLVNTIIDGIVQMLNNNRIIPFLISKLDDYDDRYLAAIMLGWFGARAQSAISDLISLASGSSGVVEVAKQSVIQIGNAESEIISALQNSVAFNDDGEFRELSNLAVRYGCSSNTMFQNILKVATESDNPDLREAVADIISTLEGEIKQGFTSILDILKSDPNEHVRQAAFEASQ